MKRPVMVFAVVAILAVISFGVRGNGDTPQEAVKTEVANAHEGEDHSEEEAAENPEEANSSTYSYTAQPGDSYTKIARKAVQTYGILNGVELTGAQIIAAETKLTKAAGEPALEIDQQVTIDESSLKSVVEEVQELEESTLNLWERYVVGVDFNTDSVGEARG